MYFFQFKEQGQTVSQGQKDLKGLKGSSSQVTGNMVGKNLSTRPITSMKSTKRDFWVVTPEDFLGSKDKVLFLRLLVSVYILKGRTDGKRERLRPSSRWDPVGPGGTRHYCVSDPYPTRNQTTR